MNIPKDKEELIYEVSLKEFAEKGYELASTNNIVKECGFSKGTLFNYVKNKRNLYLFVVEKTLNDIGITIEEELNIKSTDIFEKIKEIQKIKLNIFLKYPNENKLIIQAFTEADEDIKDKFSIKYEKYSKMFFELMTTNVDYSKFKDGIDIEMTLSTILLTMNGLSEKISRKYKNNQEQMIKDLEEIIKESNKYLNFIKELVYK
ncbi:TetR/AcrR family transcriptional regulator [Clostridium sp. MB05]|uniref:TetR/AcrR family transcriptional regulator n=1 Tax=Clostridium sp. MB05 TaxID=3376682 RepID=UPI003982C9E8